MIDFTFGINTIHGNEHLVSEVISSIQKLCIPNYEIIIVGGPPRIGPNIISVPFDETIKPMWITKKKNIITSLAKYENIVFLHDYIVFDSDWYDGFECFGNDFHVAMNKIVNLDGTRFRDWLTIRPYNGMYGHGIIPYDVSGIDRSMYISGSFWIAKTSIMKEIPLNENLVWGQMEDVEWSDRVSLKYKFSMNPLSTVRLLKYKPLGVLDFT